MNHYTMTETLSVAARASNDVTTWLQKQPQHIGVLNVESDPAWQKKDVDLVWKLTVSGQPHQATIEVKGDRNWKTGNLFLETVSNATKQTEGCILYTAANWIAYYFVDPCSGLFMPVKPLRDWFMKRVEQFREKRVTTPVGHGAYQTVGRLVPIQRVLAEVPRVKTFQLDRTILNSCCQGWL